MKSRDLSIYQFFETLQKEYIIAQIRSKIFTKNHSQYWVGVMDGKREKIENIERKNGFLSIFSSKEEFTRIQSLIVPDWGFPEFVYVSEKQRNKLQKWDQLLYFDKGSKVRVLTESSSTVVGEVVDNSSCILDFPVILVKIKGDNFTTTVPVNRVSRIF